MPDLDMEVKNSEPVNSTECRLLDWWIHGSFSKDHSDVWTFAFSEAVGKGTPWGK